MEQMQQIESTEPSENGAEGDNAENIDTVPSSGIPPTSKKDRYRCVTDMTARGC